MHSVRRLRWISFALAIAIVGIGSHAYFESTWNKTTRESESQYQCHYLATIKSITCPSLAMETYFISVSIITLIFSGLLIAFSYIQPESDSVTELYRNFNLGAAVLNIIGGILVIVSAVQIYKYEIAIELLQLTTPVGKIGLNEYQFFDEKMIAGAMSIANGCLYAFTAWIGFRSESEDDSPLLAA